MMTPRGRAFGVWTPKIGALGFASVVVLMMTVLVQIQPLAQEQFYTQSGGRGLQNAKTNARLTKTEEDIVVIQDDLKTIKPHARAELRDCAGDGEKLRYDGRTWICDRETDPTVKGFAKKDLPTCTGSSILGVTNGELACVSAGFVSDEVDPTVQAFAKAPLPSCSTEQTLSVQNGNLVCQNDQKGLTRETDPNVHSFARKDDNPALPNCAGNEMLTMTSGRLACKVDMVGITEEKDPLVQNFARTDNNQPPLAACATGELLRSVTVDGKVVLACESASGALSGALALDDLSDVAVSGPISGTVLTFTGGEWRAVPGLGSSDNPLLLRQLGDVNIAAIQPDEVLRWNGSGWGNSPDKIGTLTDTNWCRTVGTEIVCDRPPPLTCNSGELLSWNGAANTWVCSDAASAIGSALALGNLNDVTLTAPQTGQVLRFDGTGWVNETLDRILAGDTQIVATDSGSDGQLLFATEGVTRMMVTNQGRVGIGVVPSNPFMLDVSGSVRTGSLLAASGVFEGDLTVRGNLNISGSQTIDGVTFANGGVQANGNISATSFTGDGSGLTGVTASSADWYSLTNIPAQVVAVSNSTDMTMQNIAVMQGLTAASTTLNSLVVDTNGLVRGDLTVAGNLNVSGSQTIDGVLFANGGIEMPGTLGSGNISTTNLSATVADIRRLGVTNQLVVGNIQTPSATVHIEDTVMIGRMNGTTTGVGRLMVNQAANTHLSGLAVVNTGGGSGRMWLDAAGNMILGRAEQQLLVLTQDGNVGISTTTPNAKLAVAGLVSATNVRVAEDLTVLGNLNVSGTQTIDGVTFANGGVQAAGVVSATGFSGDGSGLTNIPATGLQAAGVTGSVQFKAADGSISGTTDVVWSDADKNLSVAGTVKLAGSGGEACVPGSHGTMRFVDTGGGNFKLQICRP